MKKRLVASLVVLLVLATLTVTAFAATARVSGSCPRCGESSGTYTNVNKNTHHITKCGCGHSYDQSHTITNYSTRECVKCGDVIGD